MKNSIFLSFLRRTSRTGQTWSDKTLRLFFRFNYFRNFKRVALHSLLAFGSENDSNRIFASGAVKIQEGFPFCCPNGSEAVKGNGVFFLEAGLLVFKGFVKMGCGERGLFRAIGTPIISNIDLVIIFQLGVEYNAIHSFPRLDMNELHLFKTFVGRVRRVGLS